MNIAASHIDTAELNRPPVNLLPATVGVPDMSGTAQKRRSMARRVAPVALIMAVLAGGGFAAWTYWTQWRFEVSTDDAYVQADTVMIAPQVAGNIASLFVDDNQQVKAGQVLAIIDQSEYSAAVEKAQAGVQQAQAAIATDEAQIAQQQAMIAEAQATIDADKASECKSAWGPDADRHGR